MAFVNEKPWHGLGVEVPAGATPQEFLEAAGLDWTVKKVPAFIELSEELPDGRIAYDRIVTDRCALVRSSDNRVLDVVSNDWNVLQNQEAFSFFNDFTSAADMTMETAGSLKDGGVVWGLARVKESFEVVPGDRVDSYLLLTNYHMYGRATDIRFTPIRVVCNNTLSLSLGQKAQRAVKVSHRKEFDGDAVKLLLGVAAEKLSKYKEVAQFLAGHRYTDEQAVEYAMRVFPLPPKSEKDISKNAARLLEVIDEQPGHAFAECSWWNAYNAVSYMTDHELGRTADTRLQSAWYGHSADLKVGALNLAKEMAA